MTICLTLISCRILFAQEPVNWEATFENNIRPVLAGTCFACHGDANAKLAGGLRIDSREALLKGGDSGPAIDLQQPSRSLLVQAIARADGVSPMPPDQDRALRRDQVNTFTQWIAAGALGPRRPVSSPANSTGRSSLCPRAIKRSASIIGFAVNNPPPMCAWLRGRQVHDCQEATFDLTGLPPTHEQVQDFVTDHAPDAYARLIDRLLESPAYGERWGRHWLDVVRYADTAGETADYPVPMHGVIATMLSSPSSTTNRMINSCASRSLAISWQSSQRPQKSMRRASRLPATWLFRGASALIPRTIII